MVLIKRFEDIICWQKAKQMWLTIYLTFQTIRDYWFKDQIQRSAISVSNNIAEGFERKTNNEFRHFLYIAKWSCGEVRSMLSLANDLWYIDGKIYEQLWNQSKELSKIIWWLIRSLK